MVVDGANQETATSGCKLGHNYGAGRDIGSVQKVDLMVGVLDHNGGQTHGRID